MLALARSATLRIALVAAVTLAPLRGRAQQAAGTPQPSEQPMAALPAGRPAPFDGVLVPPGRFKVYLEQQTQLADLRARFDERDKLAKKCVPALAGCEATLKRAQAEMKPHALYDHFWVGVGATVLTVLGGVYGYCKLTKC